MINTSFGSTYCNIPMKLANAEAHVELYKFLNSLEGKTNFNKIKSWITVDNYAYPYKNFFIPDNLDNGVEAFLKSKNIKFKKYTNNQLFNEISIKRRLCVKSNLTDNFELIELNTNKFDKIHKEYSMSYSAENKEINANSQYDDFKEYIKTNKRIQAPVLYLSENNKGTVEAYFEDGAHKYEVMRDLGFKSIPFAMNKKSLDIAKKHNLL